METKKIVLAIVVGYIVLLASSYVIHGVWLQPAYHDLQEKEGTFRAEGVIQHKMWIMWIGNLLFTVLFAYIYTRGVESKPWVGQGSRYAILITLFAVVPYTLGEYVVYRVPHMLAIKWIVAGGVQMLLLGLIVAGFCKKAPA